MFLMNFRVQNLLQFWQTAAKACHFREAIFIPATLMSDWIEKKGAPELLFPRFE